MSIKFFFVKSFEKFFSSSSRNHRTLSSLKKMELQNLTGLIFSLRNPGVHPNLFLAFFLVKVHGGYYKFSFFAILFFYGKILWQKIYKNFSRTGMDQILYSYRRHWFKEIWSRVGRTLTFCKKMPMPEVEKCELMFLDHVCKNIGLEFNLFPL